MVLVFLDVQMTINSTHSSYYDFTNAKNNTGVCIVCTVLKLAILI